MCRLIWHCNWSDSNIGVGDYLLLKTWLIILHFLKYGIHLKLEFDQNSNVSHVGICLHIELQSVCYIYASSNSHRKTNNTLYSFHFVNSSYIVKIVGWRSWFFLTRIFHVNFVCNVRSIFTLFDNDMFFSTTFSV